MIMILKLKPLSQRVGADGVVEQALMFKEDGRALLVTVQQFPLL